MNTFTPQAALSVYREIHQGDDLPTPSKVRWAALDAERDGQINVVEMDAITIHREYIAAEMQAESEYIKAEFAALADLRDAQAAHCWAEEA